MSENFSRAPNTKCKVCNIDIYRRPSQIEKGHVFCSRKCGGHFNRKITKCVICDNEILASRNTKTCNKECADKLRGIAASNRKGPYNKDKKEPRKVVGGLKQKLIETYGDGCNRCGYDELPILQVHHIVEKCNGGTDEIDNLQLFCPNCHAGEHYLRKIKILNEAQENIRLKKLEK